jgi:cytochrome P450
MGDFWKRQEAMRGPGAMSQMGRTSLFFKDPPDHGRLRGLVSRALFTPNAIERLRPRIEAIVGELLAPACDGGTIERDSRSRVSAAGAGDTEMLGVPSGDRERFHFWTQSMNLSFEPAVTPEQSRRCHGAVAELDAYLRALVRERRSAPGDDVLSALIAAEDAGDRLSEDEIVGNTALLLSAGYETTMGLIGNGVLSLLRFPEQITRLQDRLALLGTRSRNSCATNRRYNSPAENLASRSRSEPRSEALSRTRAPRHRPRERR